MTNEIVNSALSKVMYPGFTKDIVTFGFVNSIKIDGNDVSFSVAILQVHQKLHNKLLMNQQKNLKQLALQMSLVI